ncbi:DUF4348 domain-containing protein [Flavobacterium sp. LS1R47]|jgi:hypothetical protein|uniref:DUF4348 domain-containing protein n=1 Tax=Flavobacterium frigoritolerans TaxID=2987686 RepID=A0A9X2Z1J4_9FLAO|nr:DUF4348 domain-containing protein [Flavobacterium frigoritolerans]MCV9933784.1 DUF4348 domain-containing protein [Flavobacterium frigoritolerans]
MKIILRSSFVILLLLAVSCKKEIAPQNSIILKDETESILTNDEKEPEDASDKTNQEDFNHFFRLFNHDAVFQISRVNFPLKVKINNDDLELVDYIIPKEKYTSIDLDKKPEERGYKQQLILKKDKAVIQQRGIDNGIFIDYFFEKKDGKWQLVTWVDIST